VKPWMLYALAGAGGLVLGIVVAKYTLPPKTITKTETKIEQVEVVKWRDREVKVEGPVKVVTKTTTVPGPAGPTVVVEKVVTKESVTTVIDNSGASTTGTKVDEKTSKTVDNRAWFAIEGAGALSMDGRWAWSGAAQIRVLGPLWLGAGVIKADTWYVGPTARMEF